MIRIPSDIGLAYGSLVPENVTVQDEFGGSYDGVFRRRTRSLCLIEVDTDAVFAHYERHVGLVFDNLGVNVIYNFNGGFFIRTFGLPPSPVSSSSTSSTYREFVAPYRCSSDSGDSSSNVGDVAESMSESRSYVTFVGR